MMKRPSFFGAAAVLALATLAWPAQSVAQQQFYLDGPNPTGANAHGVYIGPYVGNLGSSPGTPTFDLICDDYWDAAHVGQTWTANVTSVLDATNLATNTRFGQIYGSGVATGKYETAIWLATQFYANPAQSNGTNWNLWAGIHSSLWDIFADGSNGRPATNWSEQSYWNAIAGSAAPLNMNELQNWYIVTDVNTVGGKGGTQEYLMYVTPEPATLILLATGMAGLLFFTGFVRRTAV